MLVDNGVQQLTGEKNNTNSGMKIYKNLWSLWASTRLRRTINIFVVDVNTIKGTIPYVYKNSKDVEIEKGRLLNGTNDKPQIKGNNIVFSLLYV